MWKSYHVAVEEAQEAPDVVHCMFFVNDNTVVVLFNFGASHSFISVAYVEKHNLPIASFKCQIIAMRGDMPTKAGMPEGES
jgi:hypothetical protein